MRRPLYQTAQKPDESNDSYLARHDAAFEDMISKNVSLEQVRAYVMIRRSQLSSEDRKRIVVGTQENLTYTEARKAFLDQGSSRISREVARTTSTAPTM